MGDVRFVARWDLTAFAKARPYAYASEVSCEANSFKRAGAQRDAVETAD